MNSIDEDSDDEDVKISTKKSVAFGAQLLSQKKIGDSLKSRFGKILEAQKSLDQGQSRLYPDLRKKNEERARARAHEEKM